MIKTKYRGFTIHVDTDDSLIDPRSDCPFGTMVCFHRRYRLGDVGKHSWTNAADFKEWLEDMERHGNAISLPLYLYDHGTIAMSTKSFIGRAPHAEWDSGQVGVIYATHNDSMETFGQGLDKMEKKVLALLRSEVEHYDRYLRGEVYQFNVYSADGEWKEGCGGLTSPDEAVQAAKESIDDYMATLDAEVLEACECDNTHKANNTVCRYCYAKGRRAWDDPE